MPTIRGTFGAAFSIGEAVKTRLETSSTLQYSKSTIQEWFGSKPFDYDELPTPTSIRLVKIHPANTPNSNEVHITLDTVDLDYLPKYLALSYTWAQQRSLGGMMASGAWSAFSTWAKDDDWTSAIPGESKRLKQSRSILCNGAQIKIFENVFDALKQLRERYPGEWLWIDALSINQKDQEEKAQQVQLMGEIYQLAQTVVVWLGELTNYDEVGLRFLQELVDSGKPLPPNPLFANPLDNQTPEEDDGALDGRLGYAVAAAFHLVRRTWFRRVWVIQELCLAKDIVFIHGRHEVSLEVLYASCEWFFGDALGRKGGPWMSGIFRTKVLSYFGTQMQFLPTMMSARQDLRQGNKWTLLEWCHSSAGRKATDSKDYIFAGLALVRDDVLSIDNDILQPLVDPPQSPPGENRQDQVESIDTGTNSETAATGNQKDSLLSRRLWSKLVPDYSVSNSEVFINATACLLTHEPLEEVLRLAFRRPAMTEFMDFVGQGSSRYLSIPEAPSWVLKPESQSPGLPLGSSKLGTRAPWAAWTFETPKLQTPQRYNRPTISPDGRILTIQAARFDTIESEIKFTDVADVATRASGEPLDLLGLIQYLHDKPMWYTPDYTGITVIDDKEVATPKKVTLFEVLAYTMVSGHVGGRLITHAEAQSWLAESLESRMLLRVAKRGQHMSENLVKLKNLEAATEEQAFEDATSQEARTYQATKHAVDEDKQAIEKLLTSLNSLKDKYSQILWPGEAVAPTISTEARAAGQKEESQRLWSDEPGKVRLWGLVNTFMWKHDSESEGSGPSDIRRPISDACRAFEESAILAMASREFWITRRGFIGSTLSGTSAGDQVVLIPGCSVPFVLWGRTEWILRNIARLEKSIDEAGKEDTEMEETVENAQSNAKVELASYKERLQQAREDGRRYFLAGDAYFEGIMQGELSGRLDVERFNIN